MDASSLWQLSDEPGILATWTFEVASRISVTSISYEKYRTFALVHQLYVELIRYANSMYNVRKVAPKIGCSKSSSRFSLIRLIEFHMGIFHATALSTLSGHSETTRLGRLRMR